MVSPSAVAPRAFRAAQPVKQLVQKRGFAAPASGSFTYETGDAAGVKYASRDLPAATTTLAVVAKAGSRYQPSPAFSDALEKFAFKSTYKRSALRITRESELLGGELSANHTRELLVLRARFMKEDLPYFTELMGEVISKTRFTAHELSEEVEHVMKLDQKGLLGSPANLAINSVHGVAFHHGLGTPTNATSSSPFKKYLDAQAIADFADVAYSRKNIAVVANGADHQEFAKWVKEFFQDTKSGSDVYKLNEEPTKYYGGEERIAHASGNVMILAFPGSSSFTSGQSFKPEIQVLATLLGGQSSIKWSSGFSMLSKATADIPFAHVTTRNHAYSDAGLLTVTITGTSSHIAKASKAVVDTLKSVASGNVTDEDIAKATALARFRALSEGQQTEAGIEATGMGLILNSQPYQIDELGQKIAKVTPDQVKSAAKSLLDQRASVSSVGDLFVLPWAADIGLKV
ncbi:ubiquinol-cytochrome c reductase core subunit 1 [Lithohypha guttulata]|uniref:Cytochrome b-c1 complex subunit 2, mitochondrial n=1 Tax=Lithohypha guttulata TaxID=1690604 RepID=A0AAN7T497_9EURO|nr:ubiquinol-cytochrome c reductase core subunit 1 [Lithohypha guttulata]